MRERYVDISNLGSEDGIPGERRKEGVEDDFDFSYESEGYGWAIIRIGIGSREACFEASYVGDNPLEGMLMAVNGLCKRGDDRWTLRWESEPGTMEVMMKRNGESVRMSVRVTDGDTGSEKDACQWEEFSGKVSVTRLKEVVINEAKQNLVRHGLVGFSEDWAGGRDVFPLAEFLSLLGVETIEVGDESISSFAEEVETHSDLQELQELGDTK